jgi:hypothetical protein
MRADTELARLLENPAIWRGRSAARLEVLATGFAALDESLPGHGWPRTGLIEILVSCFGTGELYLLLPALAALTQQPAARWCAWVVPEELGAQPFAPALIAHGMALDRVLVVRTGTMSMWAFEQSLGSGACDAVLGWARRPHAREIRRLQLAAERGRTLGILFRPRSAARESSAAMLRMALEPVAQGARITLLKSRGGTRKPFEVAWSQARS